MDTAELVKEAAVRVFADLADAQRIMHEPETAWKATLWQALEEMDLPRAWAPEDLGGQGLALADGFAVVRAAGRAGLAVPLVDTMLAAWVLGQAGLSVPAGAMSLVLAPGLDTVAVHADGRVQARLRRVPFAREVEHLVVIATTGQGTHVACVPRARYDAAAGSNLAGDACDAVNIGTNVEAVARTSLTPESVWQLGAVLRSLQMAGALESSLQLSVRYATERIAFGKPIGKFQAIQHKLALLGGEVAAALAAAESAADAYASLQGQEHAVLLEVAAAKIRCGQAAEVGAAIAHQVHGALGYTAEHVLHRYTLRALAWRDDYGSETYWCERLGRLACSLSSEQLWQLVASR